YHVTYEDVSMLAPPVLRHRVLLNFHAESDRLDSDYVLAKMIEGIPVPRGTQRADAMKAQPQRFLDPKVLAGISTLDLVARTVVDGFVSGLHRSPDFGFSQEFAEYRPYTPGDDPRRVDWNVFARLDRIYLKRYRGETNTLVTLLLDCSASMRDRKSTRLNSSHV